jgi:phospholipid transport system substrate-binding protein
MRVSPVWIALTLVIAQVTSGRADPQSSATGVIGKLDTTLLEIMREADQLGFQGRVDRLTPVVDATFDLPFMAEKSLGPHWHTLSDADKTRWTALSRQFTIANFAANFDHWSNQTIDLLSEEPSAADTVMVKTKINDPQGESVEMNYRLRNTDGVWRAIDIYLKGTVSELALRRADYTALLEKDGFEALAKTMQQKVSDLAEAKKP